MAYCDGFEHVFESDKGYTLGENCKKCNPKEESKYKGHVDTYCVWGYNPSILNVVKGARYCGKRGGVALKDAVRPQI